MQYNSITDENVEEQDMLIVSINNFYNKDTLFNDKYSIQSYFKRQHSNVMIMHFGDYSEDYINKMIALDCTTVGFFNEYKAKKLYEFIKRNKDKKLAVLHCGAGISRSGAVGAFIFDMYGTTTWDEFINKNKRIQPNTHILKLLHQQQYKDMH